MFLLCLYLFTVILAGFFAYKGVCWDLKDGAIYAPSEWLITWISVFAPVANWLFIFYGFTRMKRDYNKSSWWE